MSRQSPKALLFEQFARIGQALSSGPRLELLELLAQGEYSVDALAQLTELGVANTSRHLQQLRQFVHYRLAGDEVIRLLYALGTVCETYSAEVERLVKTFMSDKDSFEAVPAEDVLARARKGLVTVLDVRPAREYAAGHVPGAINIPLPEINKRLHELPANREVVAYCRGPYCLMAFEAVALLRRKGRKARRLQDGMPEWRLRGLPVDRESPN
jgi:rhodanese-related sulfurtransferase